MSKKKNKKVEVINDLKVREMETAKNKIKNRPLMEKGVIMKHPSISLFVGSVGSGKSTLVVNLLSKSNMLGKDEDEKSFFDAIFVLTGSDDDLYDNLIHLGILDEDKIKLDPEPSDIATLIEIQRKAIKEKGIENAEKVLIILDDVIDDKKLLNSKEMRTLFIKPRQLNFTVFLLAQYFMLIPKFIRNQARHIFFFKGNRSDHNILCEQFCPSSLKSKEFLEMIEQATEDREGETHNFLHINRAKKVKERFRRNLDKILQV